MTRPICSECRTPIAPIVAIDIDGTLGEYHRHWTEFAEQWLGHPLPPIQDYDGTNRLWQFFGLELEHYRTVKLAYRQGGIKRFMPTVPGAIQFMHWLRDRGAEIWICTTRPYLRLDNIDPDTREFLQRNSIPYDHMIYGDDKYSRLDQIAKDTGRQVVAVLDDLPEQVEEANRLDLNGLLLDRPHNRKAEHLDPCRVHSHNAAAAEIEAAIQQWEETYDA